MGRPKTGADALGAVVRVHDEPTPDQLDDAANRHDDNQPYDDAANQLDDAANQDVDAVATANTNFGPSAKVDLLELHDLDADAQEALGHVIEASRT
jgi:hypothetical protein